MLVLVLVLRTGFRLALGFNDQGSSIIYVSGLLNVSLRYASLVYVHIDQYRPMLDQYQPILDQYQPMLDQYQPMSLIVTSSKSYTYTCMEDIRVRVITRVSVNVSVHLHVYRRH